MTEIVINESAAARVLQCVFDEIGQSFAEQGLVNLYEKGGGWQVHLKFDITVQNSRADTCGEISDKGGEVGLQQLRLNPSNAFKGQHLFRQPHGLSGFRHQFERARLAVRGRLGGLDRLGHGMDRRYGIAQLMRGV